jgi:hypothetical protein
MMPQNYDTTNGRPFPRVVEIKIEFDEHGNGLAEYVQRMAVIADGELHILNKTPTYHGIKVAAEDMLQAVPMVDPVTGADIGQTTNGQQLYLVLMAFIRADQKAREGEPE